ncbi:mono/diheme cytochrome c family protein [Bradyrhizobium sp. LM3.2]
MLTFCYFAYFLIVLPLLSRIETPRPVPNSIAEAVLAKTGSKSTPMVSTVIALALVGALFAGSVDSARAEEGGTRPPGNNWSFSGPFGTFDRGALQRGLKVYKEVCANCHGLSFIAFRNLGDPGGPGYSTAQVAAFASDYKVKDGPNDQGDMFERPGRPADYFPSPISKRAGRTCGERRCGAARSVADHEGAVLRARLPDVHRRLLHPVSGAGPRLRLGGAAGL